MLIVLIGCSPQIPPSESPKGRPPDGLYFMKWDSFHGYFEEEEPFIQLSFVQVHSSSKRQNVNGYKEFVFISDNGEIKATNVGINEGTHTKNFTLMSIGLRLPKMKASRIVLSKLKLTDFNNQQQIYDIGTWVLDIRRGMESQDLELGKKTFVSGAFDWYKVEITNTINKPIQVKDLEFQLVAPYSVKINTSDSFNSTNARENDYSLNGHQTKTFQFNFDSKGNTGPKFISFRPFLHYELDNQPKTIVLPTAIYSPALNTEQQILDLVR